jgi:hypothetical protein
MTLQEPCSGFGLLAWLGRGQGRDGALPLASRWPMLLHCAEDSLATTSRRPDQSLPAITDQ